jgi:hypothetical protein
VHGSKTVSFLVTVNSQEECEAFAASQWLDPTHLLSTVRVKFDQGESSCSAELVCQPAVCQ